MNKGPIFNKTRKDISSRDTLGLDGVAISIQNELCPIVNTVTPRPFYWMFLNWNYYNFLNSGESKKIHKGKEEIFNKYWVKKNDYFFILSNLLYENSDRKVMPGTEKTTIDLNNNPNGPYAYNDNYFVSRFGGMLYYPGGLDAMGCIDEVNKETQEKLDFPHLTKDRGEKLALAFDEVINNTRYYKEYRLSNMPVPKDVLYELGKVMTVDAKNFPKCKEILRGFLFSDKKPSLVASSKYVNYINHNYRIDFDKRENVREVLFDYFSPRGERKYILPEELIIISRNWEFLIGRHYFTMALQLIWKYLMINLETPKNIEKWINDSIEASEWSFDYNNSLNDIIAECNYNYEDREKMIKKGYSNSKTVENNVENGIKILISMYNRFKERTDIDINYFDSSDISINELIKLINIYKEKTIYEFTAYIMKNWIIEQHYYTAKEKLLGHSTNSFYFERINGMYYRNAIPSPDFQGIRLIQLRQVMKDLDMLEE